MNCTNGCTLAVLYAARLPPAFHSLKHLHFSSTASTTLVFHHHVCFLHGWFEETPHTCFVAFKSLSFNEVQRSSTALVCNRSLSCALAAHFRELCLLLWVSKLPHLDVWHKVALALGRDGNFEISHQEPMLWCTLLPKDALNIGHLFPVRRYRMKSVIFHKYFSILHYFVYNEIKTCLLIHFNIVRYAKRGQGLLKNWSAANASP